MLGIPAISLFEPQGRYFARWNGNVVLLTDRHNPGKDIYFSSRFPPDSIKEIYIDEPPERIQSILMEGDFVVVLRTVPAAYLHALLALSNKLSGVVWFIDDDIPDAWQDRHLPKGYGRRLTWSYLKARGLLAKLCDRIWVSTAWLAEKYRLPDDCVLTPGFSEVMAPPSIVRYFYHGTKAHLREMKFLRPVVEAIQSQFDFARFEIFGDHEVYKLFRDMPGTRILHPMKWAKFRQYTASVNLDIGFAPVLDSSFNKARSHNKLLDISRCGAVGIYSELHSNAEQIADVGAGLVVSNDPESWVQAFDHLLALDRHGMLANARKLIADLQGHSDIRQMILKSPLDQRIPK